MRRRKPSLEGCPLECNVRLVALSHWQGVAWKDETLACDFETCVRHENITGCEGDIGRLDVDEVAFAWCLTGTDERPIFGGEVAVQRVEGDAGCLGGEEWAEEGVCRCC